MTSSTAKHHCAPLPTTVLAGYLGAGKTTLLNQLLNRNVIDGDQGRRLAVMVNDFGDINIDASLIVDQTTSTITLSNGCICCSAGGALYDAIDELLRSEQRPDHLLIEASGVAEPKRIANIARAEPELTLDSVISLIDCEQFTDRLADPLITDSVTAQVVQADLLVVTKTDVAKEAQKRLTYQHINVLAPDTPRLDIIMGDITSELLIGIRSVDSGDSQEKAHSIDELPSGEHEHYNDNENHHEYDHKYDDHENAYRRWSLKSQRRLTEDEVAALFTNIPTSVLRLKGVIGRSDDQLSTLVQAVGQRIKLSCVGDSPDDAKRSPCTQLVAIAINNEDSASVDNYLRHLDSQLA